MLRLRYSSRSYNFSVLKKGKNYVKYVKVRSVTVRYATLENSDKNGLPTVVNLNDKQSIF
jgi:hypothetical protein